MVGSRNGRESGHLWFAIWIILALSAYRLTTQCIIPLQRFFEQHTSVPMADILSNGLFFWLLLLLWLVVVAIVAVVLPNKMGSGYTATGRQWG